MQVFEIIQGNDDGLIFDLPLAEGETLDGVTLASQLRTPEPDGTLIAQLSVVRVTGHAARVHVTWTAAQSANWPPSGDGAPAEFDVLMNRAGQLSNSYKAGLMILRPVTRVTA